MNLAALLAAAVAAAVPAAGAAQTAPAAQPKIGHVFTIVLENKDYEKTFGPDSEAPYLARTLASKGALLTDYYGTGHLSLDNYISMISGQAPNTMTQADCPAFSDFAPGVIGADGQALGQGCVYPKPVKTVADQLTAAGKSWRGYMEDMGDDPAREAATCAHPSIGAADRTQRASQADQYATRHNPFVYFHSIIDDRSGCDAHDVNLRELSGDLKRASTTPEYAFITPDLCSDGHDENCADPKQKGGYEGIDEFLREWVPRILASPAYKRDGLLVITFDEAEDDNRACCGEPTGPNTPRPGINGPGGGRIGAVLLSPQIHPGTRNANAISHYGYLRSVEDIFGLEHLGYAGQDGLETFQSMGVFEGPAATPVKPVRRFRVRRKRGGRRLIIRVRLAPGVVGKVRVKRSGKQVKRFTTSSSAKLRLRVRKRARYKVVLRAKRGGRQVAKRRRVSRR